MALSVVDLYRDILPRTNCGDCGFSTCLAFASMVVSEKLPLANCPHIQEERVRECSKELEEQYAAGRWLKRDMARDALEWARQRASSMEIEDLPERLGGDLIQENGTTALELPYFNGFVIITKDQSRKKTDRNSPYGNRCFYTITWPKAAGDSRPEDGKVLLNFPTRFRK